MYFKVQCSICSFQMLFGVKNKCATYYQNHNFGLNQFKQESSFILIVSFNKRNQFEKHKNIPGSFVFFPELCRDLEP